SPEGEAPGVDTAVLFAAGGPAPMAEGPAPPAPAESPAAAGRLGVRDQPGMDWTGDGAAGAAGAGAGLAAVSRGRGAVTSMFRSSASRRASRRSRSAESTRTASASRRASISASDGRDGTAPERGAGFVAPTDGPPRPRNAAMIMPPRTLMNTTRSP